LKELPDLEQACVRGHLAVRESVKADKVIAAERHVPRVDRSRGESCGRERRHVDEADIAQTEQAFDATDAQARITAQMHGEFHPAGSE